MLTEWLNPLHLSKISEYNSKFKKAKPFSHIVIKNFLISEKAKLLSSEIKKENFFEKESDLFQFKQTNDLYFSKSKKLKEFNFALLSWDFFNLIGEITSTKLKGTLDMSATLYENTDFLLPHDDEIEGRKIAYLFYLSEKFIKKDGGSFVLYKSKKNSPTSMAKEIPPNFNSLLLFEVSKNSFHEVLEVLTNKKRFTIGGWLK